MNKLMKKALEIPAKRSEKRKSYPYTQEEVQLALGFIRGEITDKQYAHAMDFKHREAAPHRIGSLLRHAQEAGWINL